MRRLLASSILLVPVAAAPTPAAREVPFKGSWAGSTKEVHVRRLQIYSTAIFVSALVLQMPLSAGRSQTGAVQPINLAERLAGGKLRAVNREVTPLQERQGVHVSEAQGNGLIWVEGTDFADGTIEVDVRGRDVLGRSFLGIAFHRKDDATYDAVYLRPFNFRATDPARHQHAVQYISVPDSDWPRLRKEFPEEFENPVDASIEPTGWVPLRLVVKAKTIQIYVGGVKSPALEVRKLGTQSGGLVGLWVGNGSDGDFANLRITATK